MIKVYQTIVDRGHGNCMQAAMASLFHKPLEEVPHFLEFKDHWFSEMRKFLHANNYDYEGMLHNKNYSIICTPTYHCFNKSKYHKPSIITKKKLYNEPGVNGYFFASVLSPKYFNWGSGFTATHAVIIDRDYNVVHDVNPGYKDIIMYPLAELLKYNGLIDVYLINPKT